METLEEKHEPLDRGLTLVMPGRRVGAGQGWTWVAAGWKLFAAAPLMWVIAMVVLFVLAIVMGFVPLLGSLAYQVLQAVIAGGFVAACRSLETGGEFDLEHLLAGFTRRFVPLAVVGLLMVAGMVAILGVLLLFVGSSLLGAVIAGDADSLLVATQEASIPLAIGALVALALAVPLLAAYWFAPALVMIHGVAPLAAMKASFVACVRNIVPFLVYGLVTGVALVLALIPFGLGLLVWVPLIITSTYVAYRRIFTDEAAPAA